MSVTAKSVVDSLREIVQDLLVPEMKSVKVSIDSLRTEMKLRDGMLEQLIISSNKQFEQTLVANNERLELTIAANNERMEQTIAANNKRLEQMIDLSGQRLEEIVRAGDERNAQATRNLSEKLDFAIDIRERLVVLEARLPRQ